MTIEERAEKHAVQFNKEIGSHHYSYCIGAKEQKAIDDAEIARLKKAWEKEAEVNHDTKMAYAQGYHDVIDKAVAWVDHNIGTLTAIALRKAMEEE